MWLCSGDYCCRRWKLGRGEALGAQGAPAQGLSVENGGQRRPVHVRVDTVVNAVRLDGALVKEKNQERAHKLRREKGKVVSY